MAGISQGVSDVRSRLRQGVVGALALLSVISGTITMINAAGQTAQVGTIVVDTATDAATYAWTINGVAFSIVAESGTGSEIAAQIADAVNDEPLVRGQVAASAASTTVTLTATTPGVSFTASDSDGKITTTQATTAAASASTVTPGRALISQGFNGDEADELGALPLASRLSAQVDTWATVYDASVLLHASVTIDGVPYSTSITSATDAAASVALLVTALNNVLPANSVLASADGASLVLTAEVPGKPFSSSVWFGVGRDTGTATLTRTAPASSDINRVIRGVALLPSSLEYALDTDSVAVYGANAAMRVATQGSVWVECAQDVSPGDPVYVETASGADLGKFFNTSSATRIRLDRARWERDESSTNGQSIAVLSIAFGA